MRRPASRQVRRLVAVLLGAMIGGVVGVGIVAAQDAPPSVTVAADDPILDCEGEFLATSFYTGPGVGSPEQAIGIMLRDQGINEPDGYEITSMTATEATATAAHWRGEITVSVEKHDGQWFAGRLDQCQG